jgi:penicillin-binding protein 1C
MALIKKMIIKHILVLILLAVNLLLCGLMPLSAEALPTFKEVQNNYQKTDGVLLDRHGDIIHELRVDQRSRRLRWVTLQDISPALITAVLQSEDRRFYEHSGVDWKALASAALKNIFSSNQRGASTITMQLAGMLEHELQPKRSKHRTIMQKWDQIQAARNLEQHWTKEQVLEAYLNLIYYRSELQGIEAASQGIFGKEPSGLADSEALLLAALIRSPNAPMHIVAKRACILAATYSTSTSCKSMTALAQSRLSGPYLIRPNVAAAPQVAHLLLDAQHRLVKTTIDGKLQMTATDVLRRQLLQLAKQNVHDGAVLVVDNKSGDILAYVANTGHDSSAYYVDGITAKRQAGSTLKPFLYEMVLEQKILTAASLLDDSPLNITTQTGLYVPHNYDNDYKGPVSVRASLSSSLNIPAVRTLMLIGHEPFIQRLKHLGIKDLHDSDYYGYAAALGSIDVTLAELVNAFRTLANSGIWSSLRLTLDEKVKKTKRTVMSPDAVFIISDILSDRSARSLTFGFENPLATSFWSAVKTGTSKDMRDNWCIGYSERYTVGVWVGNFSGEPMWNVSGISGAAPVWVEIMKYLHQVTPSNPLKPPHNVIAQRIKIQTKLEGERNEWFLKGTETNKIIVPRGLAQPHILYPSEDTIIALDPDIPTENHAVFFETTKNNACDWYLNNLKIADSVHIVRWKPQYGTYTLSIADKNGNVLDTVQFQVRGNEATQTAQEKVERASDY